MILPAYRGVSPAGGEL